MAILLSCVSARAPEPPGSGVLCFGTFLYFAEEQGRICHAGEDPEYQQRLQGYVERIDAFIIRNTDGTGAWLTAFKDDENIQKGSPALCSVEQDSDFYKAFRDFDAAELDVSVDEMLRRDGKPSFGDCV